MEKKKPNGLKEHIVRVLLKVINIMNKINFPKANISQIISHDHLNNHHNHGHYKIQKCVCAI
jgi:hypothetical protein